MNKLEEAVRLLAQHAPNDVRQQVDAILGPLPGEKPETEEAEKPKAKRKAA